jgi:hypothetical protein
MTQDRHRKKNEEGGDGGVEEDDKVEQKDGEVIPVAKTLSD